MRQIIVSRRWQIPADPNSIKFGNKLKAIGGFSSRLMTMDRRYGEGLLRNKPAKWSHSLVKRQHLVTKEETICVVPMIEQAHVMAGFGVLGEVKDLSEDMSGTQ
jgi:hypothetical protein